MIDEYMRKYVELCSDLDIYTKEGVKKHNKAMKKLAKLFHQLEDDKKLAAEVYDSLMIHVDERVRATAAAHSLGLNVNLTKAQKVLKEIMQNSPEPLSRFNAEMTLKVWKEQGYLNF
jgi:hypothetical protein